MASAFADAWVGLPATRAPCRHKMPPSRAPPRRAPLSGTTPMHNTDDTHTTPQAIVAYHAATFAGFGAEQPPHPTSHEPVYQAALKACSSLASLRTTRSAWPGLGKRNRCALAHLNQRSGPTNQTLACKPCHVRRPLHRALNPLDLYAVCPYAEHGWAAWHARVSHPAATALQVHRRHRHRAGSSRPPCKRWGTSALLFINDRCTAIDAGAYGIHLGQEDRRAECE